MITRFYVDNYKGLVNFTYEPKQFELILGANGTGKTTVFEALGKVREFVMGNKKVEELFLRDSCTRWDGREEQRFELDIRGEREDILRYVLVVDYVGDNARVKVENFFVNEFFWTESETKSLEGEEAKRFVTMRQARQRQGGEVAEFPVSSPNSTLMETGPGLLMWDRMRYIRCFSLKTETMNPLVIEEEDQPTPSLSNFASYYSHLLQEDQGAAFNLMSNLREVLSGFEQFALPLTNRGVRKLTAVMNQPKKNTRFGFDELSDGQRALVALYALIHCTLKSGVTLLIDEPENYVSMRELQPWLITLEEKIEEQGGQVILISHNMEIVNFLAPERAVLFERNDGGPVTVRPFTSAHFLSPADTLRRGWES